MKNHTGNDTSVCFQYWYSVLCFGTATYTGLLRLFNKEVGMSVAEITECPFYEIRFSSKVVFNKVVQSGCPIRLFNKAPQ